MSINRGKAALALIGLAACLWFFTKPAAPTPAPTPGGEISLVAAFQGPTAADDAMLVASMSDEVASVIEWDGAQPEPALKTAQHLDQLRTRTREFLCRGQSLGERHPRMRQIVGEYLERKLGTAGGAITPERRAEWVAAYREVARASRHAVQH